jgi:hypothetical protein
MTHKGARRRSRYRRRDPGRGAPPAAGSPSLGTADGGEKTGKTDRTGKKRDRLQAEHAARRLRIKRWRTVSLSLGIIPLVGLTACDVGLVIACLPREIYLGMWAAIVGAVAGLSIRLVLERRRFEQQSRPG